MFNKETYIQRRNRLKKEIGKGILLFLGNNESGMNYADNTYHFRQDSTFLYFFGSDYAGLSALIDIDEDREIIFGDELTIDDTGKECFSRHHSNRSDRPAERLFK